MANRYMPDLLGVVLCLSACFFVSKRNKISADRLSYCRFAVGCPVVLRPFRIAFLVVVSMDFEE